MVRNIPKAAVCCTAAQKRVRGGGSCFEAWLGRNLQRLTANGTYSTSPPNTAVLGRTEIRDTRQPESWHSALAKAPGLQPRGFRRAAESLWPVGQALTWT